MNFIFFRICPRVATEAKIQISTCSVDVDNHIIELRASGCRCGAGLWDWCAGISKHGEINTYKDGLVWILSCK